MDGLHVLAVDDHAGHVVGVGAAGQVIDGRGRAQRRVLAVQVVGDDEHHGHLPDRGHVQRLVEGADVGGAVTEEGERDVRLAAELEGHGGADGDGHAGTHDGVGPDVALGGVDQVHRAADARWSSRWRGPSARRTRPRAACPGRAPRRDLGRCWSGHRPAASAAIAPTETASCPWHRCVVPWMRPAMNSSWTLSSKQPDHQHLAVPLEAAAIGFRHRLLRSFGARTATAA